MVERSSMQQPKIVDFSTRSPVAQIPKADSDGLMLLAEDHRRVYGLFEKFQWIDYNQSLRRDVFNRIVREIRLHHAIESGVLHPVIGWMIGDDVQKRDDEEHEQILNEIEEINQIETEAYTERVPSLMKKFVKHAENEENTLFPLLRKKMSLHQLEMLNSLIKDIRTIDPDICRYQTVCLLKIDGPIRRRVDEFLSSFDESICDV